MITDNNAVLNRNGVVRVSVSLKPSRRELLWLQLAETASQIIGDVRTFNHRSMEDIEDILAGGASGGVAPGFRLPLAAVGINPSQKKIKSRRNTISSLQDSNSIPGTQVLYVS